MRKSRGNVLFGLLDIDVNIGRDRFSCMSGQGWPFSCFTEGTIVMFEVWALPFLLYM